MTTQVRRWQESRSGWFRLAVAAILALGLCLWPSPSPRRPLAPHDTVQALALGEPEPYGILTRWAPVTFKLVIGEDTAEAGGTWKSLAEIAAIDRATYFSDPRRQRSLELHPYRFVDAVAFPIGTHQRLNRCNLTLVLDNTLVSRRLRCDSLVDNALARFEFDSKLAPGVYEARLESSANGPNAVSPHVQHSFTTGQRWVLPRSWPADVDTRSCLRTWFGFEPWWTAFYVVAMLGLLGLSVQVPRHRWPWFAAYALIVVAALLVTRPFSGHDETFHVDMFYTAATNAPESAKGPFYEEARQSMVAHDFFRLHAVQPQAPGQCPHAIIGGCGRSEKALWYYGKVAAVLAALGLDRWTVSRILWSGRLWNVGLLVACFGAVAWILGAKHAEALTVIAAISGIFLGQLPSVTSDFPLLVMGLFGVAWLGTLIDHGRSTRTVAAGILLGAMLLLGIRIDRSWLAGLPLLAGMILYLGRHAAPETSTGPGEVRSRLLAGGSAFALAFVASVGGALLLAGSWASLASRLPKSIVSEEDLSLTSRLGDLDVTAVLQILSFHLQSLFGTFLWGHSAYGSGAYLLLGAVWLAGSVAGFAGAVGRLPSRRAAIATGLVLGTLLGSQVMIALAVAQQGPKDMFAKLRLSSPGIVVLTTPLFLAVLRGLERPASRTWIYHGMCAWLLVLGLYYLPRFFIGDLW